MKPELTSNILEKLKEQKKEEGTLPGLLDLYCKLLHVQDAAHKQIGTLVPGLDDDVLRIRLRHGIPLLSSDDFSPEPALVQDLFTQVLAVFAEYKYLPEETNKSTTLSAEAIKAWYSNEPLPQDILAGVDEPIKHSILQTTLEPFLAGYAETLGSFIEQKHWRRNFCPICGDHPDMGTLKGDTGTKWLVCSRCDTEWLYMRLECPHCGNQEQSTLAFYSNDNGQYRLDVCNKCKGYLKSVDQRKAEYAVLMPLERFYTIDMDLQAAELGYHAHPESIANKTQDN